jgi:hypothetical protein
MIRTANDRYITRETLRAVLFSIELDELRSVFTTECLDQPQNLFILGLIRDSMLDCEFFMTYVNEWSGIPTILLRIEPIIGNDFASVWKDRYLVLRLEAVADRMMVGGLDLAEDKGELEWDEEDDPEEDVG